jgi:hypothetical protein
MRNARIVHEYVESAEPFRMRSAGGADGGLIRDFELEGAGIRSDALRGRLKN